MQLNSNQILKIAVILLGGISLLGFCLPWVRVMIPFVNKSILDNNGADFIGLWSLCLPLMTIVFYIVSLWYYFDKRIVYPIAVIPLLIFIIMGSVSILNKDTEVLKIIRQIGTFDTDLDRILKDAVVTSQGFWLFLISGIGGCITSLFIKSD